jgi:hypothetical protein
LYARHDSEYIPYQHPSDAIIEDLKETAILGRAAAEMTMRDVQMRLSHERTI